MGHRVIASTLGCAALAGLAGCSLIYNPANLPDPLSDGVIEPDAMPDMQVIPIDADPGLLEITDVSPRELLEGQGIDGSRKAVVIVTGVNMIETATVQITAHAGETQTPAITVDNAAVQVSIDGLTLAVPVTVDIDPAIGPTAAVGSIRLDVTVTQPTAGGPVSKTLSERGTPEDPVLTLVGLEEHLAGPLAIALDQPRKRFAKIDATTLTFTGSGDLPFVEAVSSITIADPVSVDGNGITAGPGNPNNGGSGGQGILGEPGSPGNGDGKGLPNAGGGGFGTAGQGGADGTGGGQVGAANLASLASPNLGSGGAGAAGPALNARGGDGGGGGGTIAITAGGNLAFERITANGGNGVQRNGNTGGGGSGGAVLLRAGNTITIEAGGGVSAIGGTSAQNGGGGGAGRVRFDAGVKATSVASTPAVGHRGVMLDAATPLIVRDQRPAIMIHGQPNTDYKYTVENEAGTMTRLSGDLGIPSGGTAAEDALAVDLFRGFNRVCLRVQNATGNEPEGVNCVTIAFVP